jgi:hypothetical protein
MFRARGHALRLQAGKGEGANIVLMNFDVHVGDRRDIKPYRGSKVTNQIDDREQIFTGCAEGNVLGFHGRQSNFCLKLGLPKDRTVEHSNEVPSTATSAMRVLGIFMTVKPSEVGIRVAIHTWIITRTHDDPFVHCAFEIPSNAYESQLMTASGTESVPSTLMHSKGNVWASVTAEIK